MVHCPDRGLKVAASRSPGKCTACWWPLPGNRTVPPAISTRPSTRPACPQQKTSNAGDGHPDTVPEVQWDNLVWWTFPATWRSASCWSPPRSRICDVGSSAACTAKISVFCDSTCQGIPRPSQLASPKRRGLSGQPGEPCAHPAPHGAAQRSDLPAAITSPLVAEPERRYVQLRHHTVTGLLLSRVKDVEQVLGVDQAAAVAAARWSVSASNRVR